VTSVPCTGIVSLWFGRDGEVHGQLTVARTCRATFLRDLTLLVSIESPRVLLQVVGKVASFYLGVYEVDRLIFVGVCGVFFKQLSV